MNVEPELLNHPKYRRLRREAGPQALEFLLRLWGHCGTNKRGEHWPNADADYLETVCEWEGPKGALFALLVSCRFVDVLSEGGVRIHDWNEQNSFTVQNWNRNPHGRRGKTVGYPTVNPRQNPRQSTDKPWGDQGEPLRVSEESEKSEESESANNPWINPTVPDGGVEANGQEAHIPTEAEFLKAFATAAIPEEFLRKKFRWFQGNQLWLNQHGRLKDWFSLVVGWWSEARAEWVPEKKSAPGGGIAALKEALQ